MNIINLHTKAVDLPGVSKNLFAHMESSLKDVGANFEKSVRIAKTIAPILQDQSSNDRHLEVINSDAPTQEKVIAIVMLGFPKNRLMLPILRDLLLGDHDSLAIAASVAISQMGDGNNNELLIDILIEGFQATNSEGLKKSIKNNMAVLINNKSMPCFSLEPTVF